MSRRCRASLQERAGGSSSDLSSGCDCGRLGGRNPPCIEPLIYGELLKDPDFEIMPGMTEVDGRLNLPRWKHTAGSPTWEWAAPSPETPGFVSRNALLPWWATNFQYTFDTTEALTGTYALRADVIGESEGDIISGNTIGCGAGYEEIEPLFRASMGDLVTISCMAKDNFGTGRLGIELQVGGRTYDFGSSATPPTSMGPIATTTTYQEYRASGFIVDADTFWIQPKWHPEILTNTGDMFFDSMSLILIPASVGFLICSQVSLITIDNSTTETAFL
jgi:hypothetical protein